MNMRPEFTDGERLLLLTYLERVRDLATRYREEWPSLTADEALRMAFDRAEVALEKKL